MAIKGNNQIRKESEKEKVIYTNKTIEGTQNSIVIEWTEEADQKLFKLYKEKGSHWSIIAEEFAGLNENQVKNRFYSTLRRLATKKALSNPNGEQPVKTKKKDLIEFVDEAILYGHNCRSKRGRKRKQKPIEPENLSRRNQELANKEINKIKPTELQSTNTLSNELSSGSYRSLKIQIEEDNENKEGIKPNTSQDYSLKEEGKDDVMRYEREMSLEYFSLENSDFIQRLLVQNDSILNEYEEVTGDQNVELEELLELEKEMGKRLRATRQFLKFTPCESF